MSVVTFLGVERATTGSTCDVGSFSAEDAARVSHTLITATGTVMVAYGVITQETNRTDVRALKCAGRLGDEIAVVSFHYHA